MQLLDWCTVFHCFCAIFPLTASLNLYNIFTAVCHLFSFALCADLNYTEFCFSVVFSGAMPGPFCSDSYGSKEVASLVAQPVSASLCPSIEQVSVTFVIVKLFSFPFTIFTILVIPLNLCCSAFGVYIDFCFVSRGEVQCC